MSGAGVDEAGDGPNPRVSRGRPDDGALAEKENDERARLLSDPIARAAALKRRRHPGADESPDDALLPDGFLLSQLDDEGRANVTWKSASPPRFRQHAASNAAGTHAGGAMVNQLLRMGRGNAAAVQQAKARSERRRMCEQLDAWVDAPSASGSGSGGGGGGGSLRNENGTVEGHARADVAAVASPNVAAAALLADVRAMSWADGADADPPPTGATPRRDASGNVAGTPGSIGRIPVGTVGRPSAGAPTSTPASASRLGAAPAAAATSAAAERADFAAANPPAFECDWGDADDGFDLAAAAAATETAARARRSAVAGSVADALGADSVHRGGGGGGVDAAAAKAAERDARIEVEGAALDAWRVVSATRRDDGILELVARTCGDDPRRRVLRLHDMWAETRAFPGDLVRLATPRGRPATNPEDPTAPVDVRCDGDTLVVMHPGTMVNSTAVGSSMQCLRRTVLQTVVPDGADGDFAQAAMLGTLSHELSEASLFAAAFGTGPGAKGFFKHAAELAESSSERLFGAGVTEREAIDRLRYVGPGVHKWTRRLVKPSAAGAPATGAAHQPAGVECDVLDGPGRRSRGKVTLTKMVDAEETVWTPKLGLRGVVDAVAVGKLDEPAPAPGGRAVVTSGVVPVELKTGYWRSAVEHGAQLTLYTLMLGERYGQRVPFGLLHYTRHPGGGAREKKDDETMAIRPRSMDLAHLMHRRNALAAAFAVAPEGEARPGGVPFALGTLPPVEQCKSECERCFVKETCMTVHAALEGGAEAIRDPELAGFSRDVVGHLERRHASELARWLRLVDAEAAATATRRATPWIPVRDVRRRGGFALDGFRLAETDAPADAGGGLSTTNKRPHAYVLELHPAAAARDLREEGSFAAQHADGADGSTASALRPSDRLVLSRKGGAVVVGRVVVSEVRETSEGGVVLVISAERAVRTTGPGAASAEDVWRVDRDDGGGTMSGRARAALVSAFASTEPRAASLRRRLFDLEPPSFDVDAATRALERVSPEGKAALAALNDEQRAAVKHVLAARDYAIVAGLPGAGKSATLAATVRALVDLGKSVLITSHTHNAVDNILERLPGVGVDEYLRVGGEEGKASAETATRTPGGERHRAKTVTELAKLADAARVVGATCYAVANNPMIIRRRSGRGDGSRGSVVAPDGHFDVVLVDEAGQMTLPSSVPPLLRGSVFVLVGDPHQLPPLVQSKRAREGGLAASPMQRLADAHPAAVAELRTQYRMADDLAKIPNVISYGGRLRAATRDVAERVMSLPRALPADAPEWLRVVADPAKRVVFLDTTDAGSRAFESPPERGKPVNDFERDVVMRALRALVSRGADPKSVAFLSPYNSQVDAMARDLERERETGGIAAGAEALTIDRAQGRDVEAAVVSMVRANPEGDAGTLLRDRRRVNVALTRAKSKLIVVGCGATLQSSPVLREVLGVTIHEGWLVPFPNEV